MKGLSDMDCYEKETIMFDCQLNYDGAPVRWLKNGKVGPLVEDSNPGPRSDQTRYCVIFSNNYSINYM